MPETALVAYLRETDPKYFGKSLELRDIVTEWLSYIPNTFPHYTRHTIQHSDEIVSQLSKLLFRNDAVDAPVIKLSPVEAYILIAAAYLHDAGMVCSDQEKLSIIDSTEWREWTKSKPVRARWAEIEKLRSSGDGDPGKNFIADLQTRFLVAEYVRARHHIRSSELLEQHHDALGRCAFGDPVLARTIAAVCVGHGLHLRELENAATYPEERDVRGEKVNVRLMACLLRLGDLLDMSSDRACPMLLNAACPLPADSFAHWSQYQRITHRLTTPSRIEITAECDNQAEHRVLHDWCQWIVSETDGVRVILSPNTRHGDWTPPVASFGPNNTTIEIVASEAATYIPTTWRLLLDEEAVLERLIKDVYEHKRAFVRELIQNAVDASRCRMYLDMDRSGLAQPEYANLVDASVRDQYPIRISLEEREFLNELSGDQEVRQVLIVDDNGIGMDKRVINKYFLQVGRSYYRSAEFRTKFAFSPLSRFGIGFLSVFSDSEDVTVETWKPNSDDGDGPIRLTLTGPRNYLLTETGQRSKSGTRIEVTLGTPLENGQLTTLVSDWCKRVEFPILVNELGVESKISPETSDEFVREVPDLSEEGARFAVKAYPIEAEGIFGEIYVFAHIGAKGESWVTSEWAHHQYPDQYPQADVPWIPSNLQCWNGIASVLEIDNVYRWETLSTRVDIRRNTVDSNLSRSAMRDDESEKVILTAQTHLLTDHLKNSPYALGREGWRYIHRLCRYTSIPIRAFWADVPNMLPVFQESKESRCTLKAFREFCDFAVCVLPGVGYWSADVDQEQVRAAEHKAAANQPLPALCGSEIDAFDLDFRKELFRGATPLRAENGADGVLTVFWTRRAESEDTLLFDGVYLVDISPSMNIGTESHSTSTSLSDLLLDSKSELAKWLLSARDACLEKVHDLTPSTFSRLTALLAEQMRYPRSQNDFVQFLENWRQIEGLPPELLPPEVDSADFFKDEERMQIYFDSAPSTDAEDT